MATSLDKVYDAFLSKVLEEEWMYWTEEEIRDDWLKLLEGAIPRFKFPRKDLSYNVEDECFIEDLNNIEIQILATYMKCEWLNRIILTWENVKPLYVERDFSQANLLDKLAKVLEQEQYNALKLERIYYRSIDGKPYKYRKLAGDGE